MQFHCAEGGEQYVVQALIADEPTWVPMTVMLLHLHDMLPARIKVGLLVHWRPHPPLLKTLHPVYDIPYSVAASSFLETKSDIRLQIRVRPCDDGVVCSTSTG